MGLRRSLDEFFSGDAVGGIVLIVSAVAAMMVANSSLSGIYNGWLEMKFSVLLNGEGLSKPLILWINDGLMAVFFLLVGLELKRELLEGKLKNPRDVLLPGLAAVGGMAIPAVIYAAFNWGNIETISGWAIPAATDIAFALGILALVGSRVPASLKIFLLTLAVFVLKSGVHATLAGVLTAFCVPLKDRYGKSPLHGLEDGLSPYVFYLIVPVFAFANAGVVLKGIGTEEVFASLTVGIALGLVLGKILGVLGVVWLIVRLGWARLPYGATWLHMLGISALAGIGFTMSLFIGTLSFADATHMNEVRLGVLGGSLVAALLGFGILRTAPVPHVKTADKRDEPITPTDRHADHAPGSQASS